MHRVMRNSTREIGCDVGVGRSLEGKDSQIWLLLANWEKHDAPLRRQGPLLLPILVSILFYFFFHVSNVVLHILNLSV